MKSWVDERRPVVGIGTRIAAAITAAVLALLGLACGGRSSLMTGPGSGGGGEAAPGGGGSGGAGGASCVPAAEVCNGLDDDCDGLVDQGDPGGGEPCELGPGECGAAVLQCISPGVLSCVPIGPVPESCNEHDDDCNGVVDDPPVCTRVIFVTSQWFLGDLGGLEGADHKCQALAEAAGLGGIFKAWLSSSTVNARDRLSHVGKPYVRADGALVALDWDDLIDLSPLYNPINLTELLGPPPVSNPALLPDMEGESPWVFTATHPDGSQISEESTCFDWHSSSGTSIATWGVANATLGGWTTSAGGFLCDDGAPLYCFEQ